MSYSPTTTGRDPSDGESKADRVAPGVWRIVGIAAIGTFMAQLDATVVNVSLANLATQLHTSLAVIQWVMSGYLLALALILPLTGWLVDRIGSKRLYICCFVAFSLTSALCGLAWSASSLIAFRILQGISGGLLAPMAQMLVARVAGKHMARVVGIAALPVLLAPFLGPVLAGAILQFGSWRWLFLINLPVGALAITLAMAFLPSDRTETKRRSLDLLGLMLLSPGLALFLYGSDHLSVLGGDLALASSFVLFALFYRTERGKGNAALIELRLFKNKPFSASLTTVFMVNGISFAGQMLIPFYLVRVCGLSPTDTGWLIAPLGLGMMCTYPFMGYLTTRFGIRKLASYGALLATTATLPLIFVAYHGLMVPVLVVSLFIRGVGVSAIGIPSISSGYASVSRHDLPMATTAMNIIQRLGGPTLTTFCATFLGWRLSQGPEATVSASAFTAAFGLLCALHALLFLATLRLPKFLPSIAFVSPGPDAASRA